MSFAQEIISLLESDYRGTHQAPDKSDGPIHDLNKTMPDIYGSKGLQYYGTNQPYDNESMSVIRSAEGKPNTKIKIYRSVPFTPSSEERIEQLKDFGKSFLRRGRMPSASPVGSYDELMAEIERLQRTQTKGLKITKINSGDWVTISRSYAKEHGLANLNNKYKIIMKTVPAKTLFSDGNSIHEWGYSP